MMIFLQGITDASELVQRKSADCEKPLLLVCEHEPDCLLHLLILGAAIVADGLMEGTIRIVVVIGRLQLLFQISVLDSIFKGVRWGGFPELISPLHALPIRSSDRPVAVLQVCK